MRRLMVALALFTSACAGGDVASPSAIEPVVSTLTTSLSTVTSVPAAESPSAMLSEQLDEWAALGIADYDLEYVLVREGGDDSGTYRAVVRDGESVSCYLDGALSMAITCDATYYSVESIFDRVVSGDARLTEVIYDETWHLPTSVDHDPVDGAYTLEVVSFVPQDPIDWVAFVSDALDWLEEVYDGEAVVDWPAVKEEASALVVANPRRANAYIGLDRLTLLVRGTFFLTPREANLNAQDDHVDLFTGDPPAGERIEAVGYLRLPGAFPNQADGYARAVHDLMEEIDAEPVCGWVADLRDPHFLDVARDLVALAPLLGEETSVAYEVGGEVEAFSYSDGSAYLNGEPVFEVYEAGGIDTSGLLLEGDPYEPTVPGSPIAVLTSIDTAVWPLAGFDRRANTRVFGQPAQGLLGIGTPGQRPSLDLPLGGMLYAPVSGGPLAELVGDYDPRPDQIVLPIPDSGVDEVLVAALEWLAAQPACASDAES